MKGTQDGDRQFYQQITMFTHNYRGRFDMNQTQGNILMTQIRAQQKLYASKQTQPNLNSNRDKQNHGKRVYPEVLFRPSLSPTAKQRSQRKLPLRQRGQRIRMQTSNLPQSRSRSGKKQFDSSYKQKIVKRVTEEKRDLSGRKRLDRSPVHQHLRTSINLRWD